MENPLITKLFEVTQAGNETEVSDFVKSHWNEFPVEVKDFLGVALMSDALKAHTLRLLTK